MKNIKLTTAFIASVLLFNACSASRRDPLLMEEERRATLEMQSVQDMVASREIPPVEFKLGSAVLLPSSFDILNRVADIFLRHPKLKLVVEGHTCDLGGEARNEQLALQRAGSVKLYLVKKGIYPESIKVYGYSHSRRVTTDTSERARALNRRVEFIFTTRHWETVY